MYKKSFSPLSSFRLFSAVLALCVITLTLGGCDYAQNQLKPDREGNMEIQDYRDSLAPRLPEVDESDHSSIPALNPYVAQNMDAMKSMPLVSISVNQSVPLRDILFELANQADYDLELDPAIRGSIIFTARNRPFDQVIERISEMAGLRYKFEDEVLRVEVDTPYNKSYKIDYLSYIRSNKGNVRNDIAVVSGEGADTGSSFEASSQSEADFWGELDANLSQILGGAQTSLRTNTDPRITATDQNPDVQPVAPVSESGQQVQVSPPDAILRVDSLPLDDQGSGNNMNDRNNNNVQTTFALNRQAGIVNVFASERQHKEVQAYLNLLRKATTAQVLIEAKILEVNLYDEYVTGVDWRTTGLFGSEVVTNFYDNGSILGILSPSNLPLPSTTSNSVISGNTNFALGYNGSDIDVLLEFLSGFGTVKALASPRMTVLNNQSAVLNVATNQVFFELDVDSTRDGETGDTDVDVSSEIRNVPEGVLVNVQPSIDLERGAISLAVRPTITRITAEVSDPAVEFVAALSGAEVQSLIPELNVQEIDTVIQVRSGQPVVIGGLLQDRAETTEEGIPGLSEVPMLGAMFRDHRDLVQKTELVIFLKASILKSPSDSVHDTDKDLYRRFSGDRRPFKL